MKLTQLLSNFGFTCEHNYIFSTRDDENNIPRRILICTKCHDIHTIAPEFTRASGVFARIDSRVLATNHWQEQEAEYQNLRRNIEAYINSK